MRLYQILLLTSGSLLTLLLTGCAGVGGDGIRITEGQAQNREQTATPTARNTTQIVHVDVFSRIATIRDGRALGDGFLIATDRAGNETAVLKALPHSASERLQTAEILEGIPGVNNSVRPATAARSAELAKIYRDPMAGTE